MPSTDDLADVDAGAAAYAATMREDGSGEFEVVMLGVGPDGHVASLFPGHPALDVDDRIAVGVTDSPKPPPERVSLTYAALNRARSVWLLVSGEEKAEAVAAALGRRGRRPRVPARGVAGTRRRSGSSTSRPPPPLRSGRGAVRACRSDRLAARDTGPKSPLTPARATGR